MKKKILAIILTAALVIAIFPLTILAEGPGGSPDYIYTAKLGDFDQTMGTVWFCPLGMSCQLRDVQPAEGYSLTNIVITDEETSDILNIEIDYIMDAYTFDMPSRNIVVTPIFSQNTTQRTIDISCEGNMSVSLAKPIDGLTVNNKQDNKGIIITIEANKTIPVDIPFVIDLPDKSAFNVVNAPENYEPWYGWDEPFIFHLTDLPKYFVNDNKDVYSLELSANTSSAADELFNNITDEGKLRLNCIQFDEVTLNDSNIMLKIFNDYLDNIDYKLKENESASYIDSSHIVVWIGEKKYIYKTSLVFEEAEETVLKEVEEKAQELIEEVNKNNVPGMGNIKLFEVTDLELISFLFDENTEPGKYTTYKGFYYMYGGTIKYSSDFNEFMDFGNIEITSDNLNFGGSPFWSAGFGKVYMYWNGVCYCAFNKNIGPEGKSVIYVPDDTPAGVDNYVAAAKKRIEDYLGEEVTITKQGTLEDMDKVFDPNEFNRSFIIDTKDRYSNLNMENQFYSIEVGDRKFYFLIAKGSDKMKNPKLITTDIKTGASIETDSPEVPLDSTVRITELEEGTAEYSKVVSKIGLTDADVFDISLHSNVTGTNVKKINNGEFEVRIPIKNKNYDKEKLKAYYIRDDGTIEMHDVDVRGGNAYFTTDHFSVYTIGEEVEITNPEEKETNPEEKEVNPTNEKADNTKPKTGDENKTSLYSILLLASLVAIVFCFKKWYLKNKFNN